MFLFFFCFFFVFFFFVFFCFLFFGFLFLFFFFVPSFLVFLFLFLFRERKKARKKKMGTREPGKEKGKTSWRHRLSFAPKTKEKEKGERDEVLRERKSFDGHRLGEEEVWEKERNSFGGEELEQHQQQHDPPPKMTVQTARERGERERGERERERFSFRERRPTSEKIKGAGRQWANTRGTLSKLFLDLANEDTKQVSFSFFLFSFFLFSFWKMKEKVFGK